MAKIPVNLRLNEGIIKVIDKIANERGKNRTTLIDEIVKEHLHPDGFSEHIQKE